jgi:hypothetical protein
MSTDDRSKSIGDALPGLSSPNGTPIAVLRAWRDTLLDLNSLLAAKGFEPLESRSTYELLTAMKGYPEKMPHRLAMIEWAFHASNLSGANKHINRYGGAWTESTRHSFWSEQFDRTCDVVKKLLREERLKLGPRELSYAVQKEYSYWSFAQMEQHVRVRAPLKQASVYGGDNGWDGRSIWNLVRRGPLPVKVEPDVSSLGKSKETRDTPDDDMDDLFSEGPHDKNDDVESEGSDWECVATPSSSSVHLDDEEYEYIRVSKPIDKDVKKFQAPKPFELNPKGAQAPEPIDGYSVGTNRIPSKKSLKLDRRSSRMTRKPIWEPPQEERQSAGTLDHEDLFGSLIASSTLPVHEETSETSPAVEGADSPDSWLDSDQCCEQVICWCQHNQVYRRMIFENKGVVPVEEWTRYWNSGGKTSLERWQKLLADLGQKGDFSSILKCKMVSVASSLETNYRTNTRIGPEAAPCEHWAVPRSPEQAAGRHLVQQREAAGGIHLCAWWQDPDGGGEGGD